jgi:oxygen-independent coproporphyrinogen-3 oxidase
VAYKFPSLAELKELSLYIHIPFCTQKCAYCDFFSLAKRDDGLIRKVIEETVAQAQFFIDLIQPKNLTTIYIGGGTPSCLPRPILRFLLNEINALKPNKPLEYTIEANPETIDEEFLFLCQEFGITRFSIGIQTFDPDLRKTLGRGGERGRICGVLDWLTAKWPGDLNMDLMAGIPGQNYRDIKEDVKILLAYSPAHVSFYTLSLEPNTKLHRQVRNGLLRWPDEGLRDELWLRGRALLVNGGYSHYEISNFSHPGKNCLHNLCYWLLKPYLGIGPSAVSTLSTHNGKVIRLTNPRHLQKFLLGKDSCWGISQEIINPDKVFFEQLMLGLRLQSGIPCALFLKRFKRRLPMIIPSVWASWQKRKLLKNNKQAYALTLQGRLILNTLLRELLEHEKEYENITFDFG